MRGCILCKHICAHSFQLAVVGSSTVKLRISSSGFGLPVNVLLQSTPVKSACTAQQGPLLLMLPRKPKAAALLLPFAEHGGQVHSLHAYGWACFLCSFGLFH